MFRNYLKTALRQLWKHKLFSILNIFGLAISMAICLLVIMIVADQYGYDYFHEHKERIYRVNSAKVQKELPVKKVNFATTALSVADDLEKDYPFVERVVRMVEGGENLTTLDQEKKIFASGFIVDADFFEVFSFEWGTGDQSTALLEPYSIVITEKLAAKLFPDKNPLEESINFGQLGSFKVKGVIPEAPVRSHIQYEYLMSYATVDVLNADQKAQLDIYNDLDVWRGLVYVLTEEQTGKGAVNEALASIAQNYTEQDAAHQYLFKAQSLDEIMPSNDLSNDIGTATPKIVLYFLMALGLIIIVSACFNYMTLSLARSLKRAKEIGIRKVNGARKREIIFQFLGEAILISFLALLMALGLLEFLIPAFYDLDPFVGQVFYLKKTVGLYLVFVIFSLFVGLMAGFFPAYSISALRPIQAIKQLSHLKLNTRTGIRKVLITIQFTFSLIFIFTVIIVMKQHSHVLNADFGIRTAHMMNVRLDSADYQLFSQQVAQIKGVESWSGSHVALMTGEQAQTKAYFDNNQDSMDVQFVKTTDGFIQNMEIEILAGNDFPTEDHSQGERFVLLNEQAIQRMGFEKAEAALGASIVMDEKPLQIIGVVKNFNHNQIWTDPIQAFGIRQDPTAVRNLNITVNPANKKEVESTVFNLWKDLFPGRDYNAFFIEDRIYNLSKFFNMGAQIIGFVGFLTMLIACMGLLGMVIYNIEGKLKEVGIRKILGASVNNIIWHLSKSFFVLIGLAILFAVPLTLFGGNMWLQNFYYRIQIGPLIMFTGIAILLLFATVTVVSQTYVAANDDPVSRLRNE